MQRRYKKLFTDTGLFALSNFSSKILTFLLVPLYTSILTTEEYGSADILSTTITLLYPILTLSIFDATLRFALDKKYDRKAVLSTSILLTGIAALCVLAVAPFFVGSNSLFGKYWWYFAGMFVATVSQLCISNYIKGCNQTKIFAIQGVLSTVVFLILNIVLLVIVKMGLPGYFLSSIFSNVVSILYMVIASRCYRDLIPFTFDKLVCREMLIYSVPMIPTSIAWWINASADKYMILGIVGVGANGLYAVAHKIPSIFTTFSKFFSQAWRISAISSFDDSDRQTYYTKVYKMYSLICLYICIVLVFAAQLIAAILFKAEYYQAWTFVPPLMIAALFEAYAGFLASIYAAAKKTKFLSISTSIGAVVNIALNFFLIQLLGTIGAPIATMLSFVVVWLMRLQVMKSFMPIIIDMKRSIVSVSIVMASGLYYAFQGVGKYLVGSIAVAAIVAINYQDTENLLVTVKQTLKGVLQKHGGK